MKRALAIGGGVLALAVFIVLAVLSWQVRHYKGVAEEETASAVVTKAHADSLQRVIEERLIDDDSLAAVVVDTDSAVAVEVDRRLVEERAALARQASAIRTARRATGTLREFVSVSPQATAALDSLLSSHVEAVEAVETRAGAFERETVSLRLAIQSRDVLLLARAETIRIGQQESDSMRVAYASLEGANDALRSALRASETRWSWTKRLALVPPIVAYAIGKIGS